MAFKRLNFTKTWLSPVDFPTEEDSEAQVRADLQLLHEEARQGLNGLAGELESAAAAESLGAKDLTGAPATVQQLLTRLQALTSEAVLCTPQTLTESQKARARENIGAAAPGQGGGELTEEDKAALVTQILASLPKAEEARF